MALKILQFKFLEVRPKSDFGEIQAFRVLPHHLLLNLRHIVDPSHK